MGTKCAHSVEVNDPGHLQRAYGAHLKVKAITSGYQQTQTILGLLFMLLLGRMNEKNPITILGNQNNALAPMAGMSIFAAIIHVAQSMGSSILISSWIRGRKSLEYCG